MKRTFFRVEQCTQGIKLSPGAAAFSVYALLRNICQNITEHQAAFTVCSIDTCPLTKFEGGLNLLHEMDDDEVMWLESTATAALAK